MQSVPEDSLATPSKALPPALGRLTDADSADGSPKIHVGRQSSMQLSNIMTNQLFEQDSSGLAQELPMAEMTGEIVDYTHNRQYLLLFVSMKHMQPLQGVT